MKDLTVFKIDKHVAKEWISPFTATVAAQVLREEQAKGFDKNPFILVDNKPTNNFWNVKDFGRIEIFERANMADVIEWIFRKIDELSPVGDRPHKTRPGHPNFYRNSNIIMVNGTEVRESNLAELNYNPATDTIQFINTAVYARKIEGLYTKKSYTSKQGKKRRKTIKHSGGWSDQAPNGVYRIVAIMAKSKYQKRLNIHYTFKKLNLGVQVRRFKKGGKFLDKPEMTAQVYPCIEIRPNTGAIII